MKAFRLFLWLWLIPVFISGLIMFLEGGFFGNVQWSAVSMVVLILAIPAFGVAYVLPTVEKYVNNRFLVIPISALATSLVSIVCSGIYFNSLSGELEIEVPIFQGMFSICLFLTEMFLTRLELSDPKNTQFRADRKFFRRAIFWVCVPEIAFAIVLLHNEFPKFKTVEGYAGFFLVVTTYSLLTNLVSFLTISKGLKFKVFSRSIYLSVVVATGLTLAVGLLFIQPWVGQVDIGMVMVLLFPSLFSASAMAFMIYTRISSDAKDFEIRKLGKSFGKKSSELEILKRQINPHFFFNNLNMLISLIESNPDKASEFGQRLSKVYRKFLSESDEDFVPLNKELDFIQEYIEIYRAKFGNAFALEMSVESSPSHYVLPDALQETVDNIFKHNVFEEENPISIEIFREDDNLIIRNSRVAKAVPDSGKTGLENIRKRYELLTGERISVSETTEIFVVNLPILYFPMIKTAVIAEDEIPSAQRLERLLRQRGFEVLANVSSVRKLKHCLSENPHPDWLFLDIELRDDVVFEALKNNAVQSRIVFTTAYPDRALEAFRHGGIDYLLKPIDEAKLDAAIEKIERFGHLLKPEIPETEEKSILISAGKILKKIKLSDVEYFFSQENVTFLKSGGRAYPIAKSLEKLEDEHVSFFRISRKHFVNRNFIDKVIGSEIALKSGEKLTISRQRRKDFLDWFAQ